VPGTQGLVEHLHELAHFFYFQNLRARITRGLLCVYVSEVCVCVCVCMCTLTQTHRHRQTDRHRQAVTRRYTHAHTLTHTHTHTRAFSKSSSWDHAWGAAGVEISSQHTYYAESQEKVCMRICDLCGAAWGMGIKNKKYSENNNN
jgi:hypothetical protein